MDLREVLRHDGALDGENTMQRYSGALRRTIAKPTQFDYRGAAGNKGDAAILDAMLARAYVAATMARETRVPPENVPMQGAHRFLAVKGQIPARFDRLRDLSLLDERDEAHMFPPLRRDITYSLPTTPATQETEPNLWHPTNPSTFAARGLPPGQAFLGADSLPMQLMSRLNPSDTRLLAGETEQLTEPFVRVEGTSERYRFFPASEELPLSGVWHDPVSFSDAGKGKTALTIKSRKPVDAAKDSEGKLLPPDPSGLPMTAPRPLPLTEEQVKTAPRAAMQYAADDISVYPGDIPMDNVVDLQEKALLKCFEQLPQDAVVENLLLDAVRPGFKRGVIQQLQQPTENQWKGQIEQIRAEKAKAKMPKAKAAEPKAERVKTEKAALASGRKKVTFDLPGSPRGETSHFADFDETPGKMLQQLQLLQHMQHLRLNAQQASTGETQPESTTTGETPEAHGESSGDKSVHELIRRCSLKLKTLKGTKGPQSAELPPRNSVVAPKAMRRPSRLLKGIEATEARRLERKSNEAGDALLSERPGSDASTLLLPQPTEEPISLTCSKGLQGLRALRGRPRVRSPRSMPKAELVCLSRSLLHDRPELEDELFMTEEEAAENMHAKITETVEQPSYEIYHDTPTPAQDLIDTTPNLEELAQDFLPTTGYPHDAKRSNYPAAIPAWVSRLSKSQDSKMAVPPAAAVLYALPKEAGGPPVVEAMPTDPRSGASQTTEVALAKLSAQEMRNIEELVAGGFVALQRQAQRVDYRHRWEEEKVRLKMIVNEPIHARDPAFIERQEQLLSKWQYPANEISPGYYIKEANLEEERQAILASKKRRSIFDLQQALREAKEQEEHALLERQQEEEKEVEHRLRETQQRQIPTPQKEEEEAKAAPPAPREPTVPAEEEPPKVELTPEQEEAIKRLKNEYRQLRDQPESLETAREMKRIKKEIAVLTGRSKKKTKPDKEPRRKVRRPIYEERKETKLQTEEQAEEEKRKERIRKLLQMQQGGAGAMLAKVIEGRGVEAEEEDEEEQPPEEEEEEEKEEEEESSEELSSSEDTISSSSVSSYESSKFPTFVRSEYAPVEYKPISETLEEWRKLPVDYCGRLLLETGTGRSATGHQKQKTRTMRAKLTGSPSMPTSMFLMVEARGPALLIYVSPEPKPQKKRWSLADLCKKSEKPQIPVEQPKKWEYLCSVVIDSTAEIQGSTMGGGSTCPYKAIKINARIASEADTDSHSPDEPREAGLTMEQKILRDKLYFSGFLSADTEAETAEWLMVLIGRKAFSRYVTVCEQISQKPSESVAASLWNPGPRELVLQGVPFRHEIDEAIFSSIKVPFLDALYCGWRGLDDNSLEKCLQNISCNVRILDLSSNEFGHSVLKQLGQFCQKKAILQLFLAENLLAKDSDAAQGLATLFANPEPLYLDLRRTAITDAVCAAIGSELTKVERPGLIPKTVNFGENHITEDGLKKLGGAIAETLPRFKVLCLPNIPQLGEDKLQTILKEVPNLRPPQLSAKYPIYPFRSLDEAEIPERCLRLPAALSGRLFMEGGNGKSAEAGGQEGAKSIFLYFFELRGPLLLRYTVPPRCTSPLAANGGQLSGQPRGTLTHAFGEGLAGISISSVSMSHGELRVTGKKVLSNVMVSRSSSPETWVLKGESADYVREWFRVITIRQAGMACNAIAQNLKEPLHPGVGQYCNSCFRRTLELGGRPLPLGQMLPLFAAVAEDVRLRSVDMSNMDLDNEVMQRLSKQTFAKSRLTLLDLSFNRITPQNQEDAVAAFCGSAKECECLILDGNPLGDNASAAHFILKLLERPILRLCLNSCGLGDAFAAALGNQLAERAKQFPFITSLELQSNAISADAMKQMLDTLVGRCPALKQLSLHGNGFETIGPFARPIQLDFTKTHLDVPRWRIPYERHLTKKPKAPKLPKPSRKSRKELEGEAQAEADRIAQQKALAFLKAKAASGAKIATTPHVKDPSLAVPAGHQYGLPDTTPSRAKATGSA